MATAVVKGMVDKVLFYNEENSQAILRVQLHPSEKKSESPHFVTVIGKAPPIHSGERLYAEGQWDHHHHYGRQLQATTIKSTPPTTLEGIEKFLGSGFIRGVGPSMAKKLVAKFGDKIFDTIANYSARLESIPGVGKKKRQQIKESWDEHQSLREIMLFLHSHGVGAARAWRIYREYGEKAKEVLQENPYRLAVDITGVGFTTADKIARELGIPLEATERIRACLTHLLQEASNAGHCALPRQELLEKACELLAIDETAIEKTLQEQLDCSALIEEHPSRLIYLPALARAENTIAQRVRALAEQTASHPPIDWDAALPWAQHKTSVELSASQRQAVMAAWQHRFTIITGGPGVGKTTIMRTLLELYDAKEIPTTLSAPTGRAAKRLAESTGREASTIHRLLEFLPAQKKFARNRHSPLPAGVYVMDESSMADVPLMAAWLTALPDDAHVILLGDIDQLPSVGPGQALRDLIASQFPHTVTLKEIFRQAQSSAIVQAAYAVNRGETPESVEGGDFFFLPRSDTARIHSTILELITHRIPERFHCDPQRDIQILSPMRRGELGTRELNRQFQEALNPPAPFRPELERFGRLYRVGDRVMQTSNDYQREVYNGDLGHIVAIDQESYTVEVRFDGDRLVPYQPGELDALELAYAITIHKSQGSEFPIVVIPLAGTHYLMLQRNLLYTAITRGKQLVVIVGEEKALRMAISNNRSRERYGLLLEKITARSES